MKFMILTAAELTVAPAQKKLAHYKQKWLNQLAVGRH
jgi:hypothetical protein